MSADLPKEAVDYCRKLVAQHDRDRYSASLFMPKGKRELVWGIYALNVELAMIRDQVSEPTLGEIRLTWWREAIDDLYHEATGDHPVLQLLAPAIETGDLAAHGFRNMIEARKFDLYEDPMPSLNDLEGYLGETNSSLLQMAAFVLAGYDALECSEVCGYGGVAHGLAGLLKSLPLHRSRGQCYMPGEMLKRRESSPAHILSGRGDAGFQLFLRDYLQIARQRLQAARDLSGNVPEKALPAFLHLSLVDRDLKALRRAREAVLKRRMRTGGMRRLMRLWWMNATEQF